MFNDKITFPSPLFLSSHRLAFTYEIGKKKKIEERKGERGEKRREREREREREEEMETVNKNANPFHLKPLRHRPERGGKKKQASNHTIKTTFTATLENIKQNPAKMTLDINKQCIIVLVSTEKIHAFTCLVFGRNSIPNVSCVKFQVSY